MTLYRPTTLVLSSQDINQIVLHYGLDEVMDQLIKRLRAAFEAFDSETTQIPTRAGFHYEEPELGLIEWMPLYRKGKQVLIKVVGYHPNNPQKFAVPTIVSTISAYDTETGHLKGLMDGVFLTALRTGAASAIATQLMAHHQSKTLGLLGCGAQAITQLHAISRLFQLEKVIYYDTDSQTLQSFEERCKAMNLSITFVPASIEDVVKQSDILCTATSINIGAGPLFQDLPSKAHLHINAVGSDFPGKTELPLDFLQQAFVCPDFHDQAIAEGECQQLTAEDIDANLMEVAQNPKQYDDVKAMRSVFDSTGLSLEDEIVMGLFMDYAQALKLGQPLEVEYLQTDAKNPYHFLLKEELNETEVLDLNEFKDPIQQATTFQKSFKS